MDDFLEKTDIVFPVRVRYEEESDRWLLIDSASSPKTIAQSNDKHLAHDLKVAANRYATR